MASPMLSKGRAAWLPRRTVMNESKEYRQWTPQRKLQIVIETLSSDAKVAEVCRREGVTPNLVYRWRKELLNSASAVFSRKTAPKPDHRMQKLEADNTRLKNVIAEITAENLELKKTLSD
jgi:transposase